MEAWATERPADPYFDGRLDAWILSRYRDVSTALRESRLIPATPRSAAPAVPFDSAAHEEFRSQALHALAPARLRRLDERFAHSASVLAAALPTGEPVDLVERYARPWALQAAGIAAEVPVDRCAPLSEVALAIFESACEPYDEALAAAGRQATVELAAFFQGAPPWNMQMFIALAHSLPAFLGSAWFALLERQAELSAVRQNPSLFPRAMDELLRLAGIAKAQFRRAVDSVTVGDWTIQRDQRAILRLDIANRDPDRFPEPSQLHFEGRGPGHLAFGTGLHACVGSTLIRSAAILATGALLDRFHFQEPYIATPVDCFAVRYVKSLRVRLTSLA